ncbi:TolC family protein [uncultured Endozoicomonas sp.]|uniref:TolC family protein n=1 Tax=uncultured Endozoicomonas sp. TaxID=432652 RepID=UPI00260ECB28|nr:TolC family protein [uncultured Endozoicomonas sp.]
MSLISVLKQAQNNNPRVSEYQHRIQSSQANLNAARWEYFPELSVSWQENTRGTQASTLNITQVVWDGGKVSGNIAQAKARRQTSEAEGIEVLQTLLMDTAETVYQIMTLKARLSASYDNERQYKELARVIKRRSDTGVSPEVDKILSAARLEIAISERIRLERDIASAYQKLREYTGKDYSNYNFATLSLPSIPPEDKLYAIGFNYSPVFKRLNSELELSSERINYQKALQYPNISLNYRKDLGSTNAGEHSDEFLLSASFETGRGFSKLSTLKARYSEREESYQRIETFKREYRRILNDKVDYIENLKRLLPPLQIASDGALSVVESYVRQFQAGKKSWLDVLNAQRERNQTMVDYLVSKVDLEKSQVDLLLYTGILQTSGMLMDESTDTMGGHQ